MSVAFTNPAERDLRHLSELDRRRVIAALERLDRTGQGDVTRLTDVHPPEYRLCVGEVRVRFEPIGEEIRVLRVLPRGRAYRD